MKQLTGQFVFALLALMLIATAAAAVTVTVGSGTATSNNLPLRSTTIIRIRSRSTPKPRSTRQARSKESGCIFLPAALQIAVAGSYIWGIPPKQASLQLLIGFPFLN